MDGEQQESDVFVLTQWQRVSPVVIGVSTWIMTGGVIVAVLAAAYLILGIVGGGLTGFNALPRPERVRVLANVVLAGNALNYGLIAAAVGGAIAYFTEDTIGYLLFGGAAVFGLAIPYVCRLTGAGHSDSYAVAAALAAFVGAATIPGVVGGLLIARDIVKRLIGAIRDRTLDHKDFTYGGEAQAVPRPVRTSLLAKCWEGPYCREFIRPQCPIFLSRKACWREKRGCYCEEDIVSAAAARINGVVLDMAPDPKQNYANMARPVGYADRNENVYRKPELSHAQKVQRCKFCVIYNEHEREKYQRLVPVFVVGTVVLCALFSTHLVSVIGGVLGFMQGVVQRFSFTGGASDVQIAKLAEPNSGVEWILVAAFTVMILSKTLQILEWMCFKAKI